jgi:hypothetical protein
MALRFLHAVKKIIHRNGIENHKRGRLIREFDDTVGFVYFGNVDQHTDDHHIVRGLTVSPTHIDEHYSIGSFDGYDITIVDRTDSVVLTHTSEQTHTWLIFEIALHARIDIPHMFLGGHTHNDSSAYIGLFTAFPALQPVPLGTFGDYSEEFTRRYSLYAAPSHFIEAEQYITAEVAQTIAAHFWPLSVEIRDGSLYVYADSKHISTQDLNKMTQSGVWLAKIIDEVASH